jgi:putative ABC transport system permease protein
MEDVGDHEFRVIGLLKQGVTRAQGLSEIDAIQRRLKEANPTRTAGAGANLRLLIEDVVGDYETPLYVLLAATGCVLIIACLNVANLSWREQRRGARSRRFAARWEGAGGG